MVSIATGKYFIGDLEILLNTSRPSAFRIIGDWTIACRRVVGGGGGGGGGSLQRTPVSIAV